MGGEICLKMEYNQHPFPSPTIKNRRVCISYKDFPFDISLEKSGNM